MHLNQHCSAVFFGSLFMPAAKNLGEQDVMKSRKSVFASSTDFEVFSLQKVK